MTETADSPAETPLPVESLEHDAAFSHYVFLGWGGLERNSTLALQQIIQTQLHMSATASIASLLNNTDAG